MKTKKRGPPAAQYHAVNQARPSIALSQNFLQGDRLIATLVRRACLEPEDLVLDIGAGTGKLTEQLRQYAGQVWAVEKDPTLIELLQRRFTNMRNVTVVEGDFITLELPSTAYKVFASIPYNTTTTILTRLTQAPNPPQDAHLVIQEQAAHKFMGHPQETMYGLMLKPLFQLSITHRFERQDFVPAPSVDSVMLRIQHRRSPLLTPKVQTLYRDFVTYCFVHGSPSLYRLLEQLLGPHALRNAASILDIQRSVTPSALDFERWLCLFCQFLDDAPPNAYRRIAGSWQRLSVEQAQLNKRHRTPFSER